MSSTSVTSATAANAASVCPSHYPQQQRQPQQPPRQNHEHNDASTRFTSVSTSEAFSKTIELNNSGARSIERGDYKSSIRALSASFLQFKKTYCQQKPRIVSLRRCRLQQDCRCTCSCCNEAIFNVDELFSWKQKTHQHQNGAASPSCSVSSSESQNSVSDSSVSDAFYSSCSGAPNSKSGPYRRRALDEEFEDDGEQEVPSVYANPVELPPDFPITQESCGFLSTTITMNLAIANHLQGLELIEQKQYPLSSDTVQEHLISAGRYYEYSIRLERARQQEEQKRMVSAAAAMAAVAAQSQQLPRSAMLPPLFITPLALLVILNNLGHLHRTMGNHDRSSKCYRQLQSTLMFLLIHKNKSGSSGGGSNSGSDHSKDLQVFMENSTLGLQTASTRPTAAAA